MIFPLLTVRENLETGLACLPRGDPREVPERIYDIFSVLKEMQNRRGGELSGGQQQQLAIGRALVTRPKLLLMDDGDWEAIPAQHHPADRTRDRTAPRRKARWPSCWWNSISTLPSTSPTGSMFSAVARRCFGRLRRTPRADAVQAAFSLQS